MDKVLGSTPELVFAYWVAVVTLCLAVAMFTTILVMRVLVTRRERARQRVIARWRGVFAQQDVDVAPQPAQLDAGDAAGFIEAWNEAHESADASAAPRMRRIANNVDLLGAATRQLERGFHDRALAIVALGHLQDPRAFPMLQPLLAHKSPIISLCAARALSQIDPSRAMSMFVPQIMDREDWVQGSVARILKEGDDGSAARELSNAILRANDEIAPKLVRFLADVDRGEASKVIRAILGSQADDHLISTCLQVMTLPEDLSMVRPLLAHPRWHVRMHAATTVGRLGDAADVQGLVPLLADSQWWVRYRTAQAIAALPGVGRKGMVEIRLQQADKYARDIIDHVLAEQSMVAAA